MRLTPKRVVLLAILFLIVVFVGFVGLSVFGPATPIVISPQTTYLTEPRDKWGHIDYIEAIRRQWSDGVTPENNAAVLIWQALGPDDIPNAHRASFYTELGIAPLPEDGDYFEEINAGFIKREAAEWMRARKEEAQAAAEGAPPEPDYLPPLDDFAYGDSDAGALNEFIDLTQHTRSAPWRADEFPPLVQWLARNEGPLALVVEATRRPKYYSPLMVDPQDRRLITLLLPDIQRARGLTWALTHRAMLHVGEGRPQQAWQDLQAAHRLARLIGQRGWLVQQLVAIAIDQTTLKADAALLHEADLSVDELREIQAYLASLPLPCNMAHSMDRSERLMALDYMAHTARFGPDDDIEPMNWVLRSGIDWNVPLQMMNEWCDRMVRAMELPTIEERKAALAAAEKDLVALERRATTGGRLAKSLLSRGARSELAGKIVIRLLLPAVSAAQHAQDRSEACLRLVQIAAALAIHRAEHGAYPTSLDELGDGTTLPFDPFTGRHFLYEKRGEGYVLWSVGRNGRDDQASGSEFCDTLNGEYIAGNELRMGDHDDIVLRVPWSPPVVQSD